MGHLAAYRPTLTGGHALLSKIVGSRSAKESDSVRSCLPVIRLQSASSEPAIRAMRIHTTSLQTHRILFLRLNPGIYLELGGLILSDNLELVAKPRAKTASSMAWQTERPGSSTASRTFDTLMVNPTLSTILVVWFTRSGAVFMCWYWSERKKPSGPAYRDGAHAETEAKARAETLRGPSFLATSTLYHQSG
jgi:hypothetical protein